MSRIRAGGCAYMRRRWREGEREAQNLAKFLGAGEMHHAHMSISSSPPTEVWLYSQIQPNKAFDLERSGP